MKVLMCLPTYYQISYERYSKFVSDQISAVPAGSRPRKYPEVSGCFRASPVGLVVCRERQAKIALSHQVDVLDGK